MLPSIVARQVRQGLEDYLRAMFPITTPFFHDLLDRFLAEPGNLLKGPYLSLQLPFRTGQKGADFFPNVPLPYPPYSHQEKAFRRLSGDNPRPTIVATGTGSGKTECFLYPILDYCYRHRGEPGIKAILIYPMNALANDQATRLARTINDNRNLKGNITAGLFIGQRDADPAKVMMNDRIITDRSIMRKQPPDILLTNYKMLDYLLIRPQDFPVWAAQKPDTLRFLVVDELHTFDGAQGTDLACLIRRLKERLHTPDNYLCAIGTSATLGDDSTRAQLLTYAANIFGETFSEDAIVTEDRLTAGEFLEDAIIDQVTIPAPESLSDLRPGPEEDADTYVQRLATLWFGIPKKPTKTTAEGSQWQVELSARLRGHLYFHNFLKLLRNQVLSFEDILERMNRFTPESSKQGEYGLAVLESLLALISAARIGKDSPSPFLQVRLHLWARELRRMVGEIASPSNLCFSDDLKEENGRHHLPVVHCRECGATAWIGLTSAADTHLKTASQELYQAYFDRSERVAFLFPLNGEAGENATPANRFRLCPVCMNLEGDEKKQPNCSSCNESKVLKVFRPNPEDMIHGRGRHEGRYDCPYCQGSNSFSIIGAQAATLTGAMINQLFASPFNDDRKLLTFSDSVQDAAHRAGFFGARTWQFNFRAALLQALEAAKEDIALDRLFDIFVSHWEPKLSPEAYVTMFLHPDLNWFQEFEAMKKNEKIAAGAPLKKYLNRRLSWEMTAELGFSARIGRSLERQEAAILFADARLVEDAAKKCRDHLKENIGSFQGEIPLNKVIALIAGLIDHLRHVGAVLHKELDPYINNATDTHVYVRMKPRFMPKWGPSVRIPTFPGVKGGKRFMPVVATNRSGTWFQHWVEKCLGCENILIGGVAGEVLKFTFNALCESGLLEERPTGHGLIWGLRSESLLVTTRVIGFSCSNCGHRRTVARSQQEMITGTPCLRRGCLGTYKQREQLPDYYSTLYRTARLARLIGQEHTGLLSRSERELIEEQFKKPDAERKPWYPNLLSCTPTLEMGIDIGDLSSLILCSVPPAKANFVQRVGRAGRRDGNSLCLTIAGGRPHDLYFYAEPQEMLAAQLETPGVFLGASAVLERQLTAWGFDRWVETSLPLSAVPPKIGTVLNQLDEPQKAKFPHNFLAFLQANQTTLCESFFLRFGKDLSAESIQHLRTFALGDHGMEGSLSWKILNGLQILKTERDDLARRIRLLSNRMAGMKKDQARDKNFEQDLLEMEAEKEALYSLKMSLEERDVLNFFTDEGLLPNYAFPEAGVTLNSIIYWERENQGEGRRRYQYLTQEFERSAGSALYEFAPGSEFFGGGRHVVIDQVDMAVSTIETWRLCAECSYLEMLGKNEEKQTCPRCSDTMWSDEGRKHRLIRLRQVVATTPDFASRIGDDRDDRQPAFYCRQTCIDCDPEDVSSAWVLDDEDFPFGYEFVSRAQFREVNFGERDHEAMTIKTAGVEFGVKGFNLCRSCGKIQVGRGPNREIKHALTCSNRQQGSSECVFLYREFSSEALRLLLPVADMMISQKLVESFLAAMHMGLKLRFAGNIDHIRASLATEPIPGGYRRTYVVLYDTVPGGTGYLKQLVSDPAALMTVFSLALERLRNCSCLADPKKDGCYRCLFAYRTGLRLDRLSRDTAIEFLARILERRGKVKPIERLSKVPLGKIVDSPLEGMFLEALHRKPAEDESHTFRKEIVNGKPGFYLRIKDQGWLIEMHPKLGPAHGVDVNCEADFLIFPDRSTDSHPGIVVFTDGFSFHRDRLALDMVQRRAIVATGNYLIWSLSYQDVDEFLKARDSSSINLLDPAGWPSGSLWTKLLDGYKITAMNQHSQKGSMSLLLNYLANPDQKTWATFAFAQTLLWLFPKDLSTTNGLAENVSEIKKNWSQEHGESVESESGLLWGSRKILRNSETTLIELSAHILPGDVGKAITHGFRSMKILALLNDINIDSEEDFRPAWSGFLRLYNILQFLPNSRFASRTAIEEWSSQRWLWETSGNEHAEMNQEWKEALALAFDEDRAFLEIIAKSDVSAPSVGYELANDSSVVVAQAEFAWVEQKLAVLKKATKEDHRAFTDNSWQTIDLESAKETPEMLIELIRIKEK